MNLQSIARASCSWCDGGGAYEDGHPCILCAGQRLSKRQQRWRCETRTGMSYPPDGDAEPRHRIRDWQRDLARHKWPLTGRGRVA